jgi:hypothetical protein
MEKSCTVCLEEFTKQPNRKQAACPYCDIKACVKCTQTYLLNTAEDPHCMGCRRGWTREVLDSILLTTWINNDYKKHRQNVLLDRERSRLPAAQVILENKKRAKEYEPRHEQLSREIIELKMQIMEKMKEHDRLTSIIHTYNNGRDPFNKSKETNEPKRVFVMPCPATGCRGFLSQAYKCGVCDVHVCPDCREIKGIDRNAEHECNPDTVATVRALKKETRPCPDCGTNIFKIDGCSLMFCTNCNTPFDWVSGKKITHGRIHNPHYFEYLRAANGGVMPRDPGDIPCGANLPNAYTWDREINRRYTASHEDASFLYRALLTITHIHHVEIASQTNNAQDLDNTKYNVQYLSNEITELRWKQLLQQREKRRIRRDEIRLRYEAFVGACVDLYGHVLQTSRQLIQDVASNKIKRSEADKTMFGLLRTTKEQLLNLRTIFNNGMMDISKRYKCQVLWLKEEDLRRDYKKYVSDKPKKVVSELTDSDSDIVEVDE